MDTNSSDSLEDKQTNRCMNCGTDVAFKREHTAELTKVVSIISQWIAPVMVEDTRSVCHSCWTLALNESNNTKSQSSSPSPSTSGRKRLICINCKCSLLRKRSHPLHKDTERMVRIRNIIEKQILPIQLQDSDRLCHPCWQRTDRAATKLLAPPQKPTTMITLPNIKRASGAQGQCFFPQCSSTERLSVPKWLRRKLFSEYMYYVPTKCRICNYHLVNDNWDQLATISNPIHTFSAKHIEDFATFAKDTSKHLDFSNIDAMSDDTLYYWIGLKKVEFRELYQKLPKLENCKNGQLALASYLLKMKTGETDERISTLVNVPRSTLMRMMKIARTTLEEHVC